MMPQLEWSSLSIVCKSGSLTITPWEVPKWFRTDTETNSLLCYTVENTNCFPLCVIEEEVTESREQFLCVLTSIFFFSLNSILFLRVMFLL